MSANATNTKAETAVSYAALILADEGIDITAEKLQTLLQAAHIQDVGPSGPRSSQNHSKVRTSRTSLPLSRLPRRRSNTTSCPGMNTPWRSLTRAWRLLIEELTTIVMLRAGCSIFLAEEIILQGESGCRRVLGLYLGDLNSRASCTIPGYISSKQDRTYDI